MWPMLFFAGVLAGAQPAIDSIHNAASNVAGPIAPQMIVAIFGQNLATSTATASGFPLPLQLAGASVTFNGVAAPLLYASPAQINAQVPTGTQSSTQANVIVTTATGASSPLSVAIQATAVGIFTQDATGCGQLAAFNVHADGSLALNTPQASLDPLNDWGLAIFLTGLGVFADRADGTAFEFNPADVRQPVATYLGGGIMIASYAAPAPGEAGVDQINAMIGTDARTSYKQGCRVPLAIVQYPVSATQYVNVSVHQGGGACVDPPSSSLGLVTWQKNVLSDVSSATLESVSAQFPQGPGVQFPSIPQVGEVDFGVQAPQPSFCPASAPTALNAGTLTATGFGGSATLAPQTANGLVSYQAALPAGSIQGGNYNVQSSGAAVGAFHAQAQIPPPISITTNLAPGTTVSSEILEIDWTGGDSRSLVTAQYLVRSAGKEVYSVTATVSAAANLGVMLIPFGFPPPQVPIGDVEIIVTQQPSSSPSQTFSAAGLTLGGEQTWNYVFDFKGLKNQ